MKHSWLAFAIDPDEGFVLHDHPVFTGAVAYDLPEGDQEILVDAELDVREFNGPGEAIAALQDYYREHPKADQVPLKDFYLIERYSGAPVISAVVKKGKAKKSVTTKPE